MQMQLLSAKLAQVLNPSPLMMPWNPILAQRERDRQRELFHCLLIGPLCVDLQQCPFWLKQIITYATEQKQMSSVSLTPDSV